LDEFASTVTAAEMRFFIKTFHTHANVSGPVSNTLTADKMKKLQLMSFGDVLYVYTVASRASTEVLVSPFNVSTVLKSKGYGVIYSTEMFDKSIVPDTVFEPKNAEPLFKIKASGYVRFYNQMASFSCPVEGSMVNTNYFVLPGIKKLVYNQQIAELCAMLATFFGMRNGSVSFNSASEAGAKLLNFGVVLAPGHEDAKLWVCEVIKMMITSTTCPESRGWNATTLQGIAFAHQLYSAIAVGLSGKRGKDGSLLDELTRVSNMIINSKSGQTPFFSVHEKSLRVIKPSITFPRIMCDQNLDLANREASIEQAYFALSLGRSFRGQNKGVKGAFTRGAYLPVHLDPAIAESVYMVTNMQRFLVQFDDIIVVTSNKKSLGTIMGMLEVLQMIEFKGKIYLDEVSNLRSVLVPLTEEKCYRFADCAFTVVLCSNSVSYAQKDSWVYKKGINIPSEKSVIIDFRDSYSGDYNKNNFANFNIGLKESFKSHYDEWTDWCFPVISRTSIFTELVTKDWKGLQIVSGVEVHNLVVWTLFNCTVSGSDWWYVFDSLPVAKIFYSMSIIANLMRCMRYVYGFSPYSVLGKLNFRVPRLRMSTLANKTAISMIWSDMNIQDAVSSGPLAVLKLFDESSTDDKARMLADPAIKTILSSKAVVDVGDHEIFTLDLMGPEPEQDEGTTNQGFIPVLID